MNLNISLSGIGCAPNITDAEVNINTPSSADADAVHIAAQAAARELAAEHHESVLNVVNHYIYL